MRRLVAGAPAFEFVIFGVPVSQQARRRDRVRAWVQTIRDAAQDQWPAGSAPSDAPVQLDLVYLFIGAAVDLDNLAKPFLDALKGLVYMDDRQVTDLILRKRDLALDLTVESPSRLLATSVEQEREFLYVAVREALEQKVVP